MTRKVRDAAIRIKLQEMTESVDMVKEHLPDSADSFSVIKGASPYILQSTPLHRVGSR